MIGLIIKIRDSRVFLAVLLLPLLVVAGCASKGDVSGEVKYKGEPITWGRISFVGAEDAVSGEIREGKYTVKGVRTGPVKISVESFKPGKGNASGNPEDIKVGPKGAKVPSFQVMSPDQVKGGADAPKGKYVPIPQKYSSTEQSGLEYTVTRGNQTYNIDLPP